MPMALSHRALWVGGQDLAQIWPFSGARSYCLRICVPLPLQGEQWRAYLGGRVLDRDPMSGICNFATETSEPHWIVISGISDTLVTVVASTCHLSWHWAIIHNDSYSIGSLPLLTTVNPRVWINPALHRWYGGGVVMKIQPQPRQIQVWAHFVYHTDLPPAH